jgi:hypothetical protein
MRCQLLSTTSSFKTIAAVSKIIAVAGAEHLRRLEPWQTCDLSSDSIRYIVPNISDLF